MMRSFTAVSVLMAVTGAAWSGTYTIGFGLPDQLLPFDTFGDPPSSVLAPGGVYRGSSDDTVLEILSGNLVASDPTGGSAGEYSALAVVAEPPENAFNGGAVARCLVAGPTISAIRDGSYPGLAVGMTMVDTAAGTYFFAAINRTTAGADYFDNVTIGGMTNRNLLVPGTGYFAVWETNAVTNASVLVVQEIPAGPVSDTEFRIDFNSSGTAVYSINGTPILSGHQLGAQPDRVGLVTMSWGTPAGNPAYTGVTFGRYQASGSEVPNGGIAEVPALSAAALIVVVCLLIGLGAGRLRAAG